MRGGYAPSLYGSCGVQLGDVMSSFRVESDMPGSKAFAEGRPSFSFYRSFGKRAFDIMFALFLIPFVAPVVLGLAVMVWAQDGAKPLFTHRRVGRNGAEFWCWKVRTMVPDAQERLEAHLAADPDAAAEWAAERKLTNDPRITRAGRALRRTSLDELPQLLNVLRGDMSFVGPRPVPEAELELYGHNRAAYEALRPGVTGLWQVSGRNDVAYAERVRMDVEYLRDHGFLKDLGIILRTAGVVLRPTGK